MTSGSLALLSVALLLTGLVAYVVVSNPGLVEFAERNLATLGFIDVVLLAAYFLLVAFDVSPNLGRALLIVAALPGGMVTGVGVKRRRQRPRRPPPRNRDRDIDLWSG